MSNSIERDRTVALSEALAKTMAEHFQELLDRNSHAIAHELLTAEDGNGGVSLKFGFQMVNGAVAVDSKVSWSRKFEDKEEGQFRFTDPNAPELPGIDPDDERKLTIRTDAGEVTTTLGAIKKAGRRLRKEGEE